MNLPGPSLLVEPARQRLQGGRPHDGIFHQENPFALQHGGQGNVLGSDAALPRISGLDEGSAEIAVADNAFHARYAHMVRKGIGRGLGRVGHRHHDAILVDLLVLQRGQVLAGGGPRPVHTFAIDITGDIGEIYPLEKAPRPTTRRRKTLQPQGPVFDNGHLARFQ